MVKWEDVKANFNEEQQDQIEKIVQAETDRVRTKYSDQIKELENKIEKLTPQEKTEEEKQIEQKQNDLWQKEINLTLKEHGLEDFGEFVFANNEEELNNKVEQLKGIMQEKEQEKEIGNSFQPEERKTNNEYTEAESKGDVQKMIGSKLSNIFK